MFFFKKKAMVTKQQALPGRKESITVPNAHYVKKSPLKEPFPVGLEKAMFGLGCFWGAERCFWQIEGVYTTAVGYAGGFTENPDYEEVCTGMTGHNEVVLVVYDPGVVAYAELLKLFWESHNPTQGMRQGNDSGTQYRSSIFTYSDEQATAARVSKDSYQESLTGSGFDTITTEILSAPVFYYAEAYHQQYLAKNPEGYCGLVGLGLEIKI